MKSRFISGTLLIIIFIVSLLVSPKTFSLLIMLCGVLGLRELINIKYEETEKIELIRVLAYTSLIFIMGNNLFYNINPIIPFLGTIIIFMLLIIFYNHDDYNISDAIYIIGIIIFLGISFNALAYLRENYFHKCIYIFVIACLTDTFAYIGGMLIGRHHFTSISPKKTIEGSIVGSLVGTIVGGLYYYATISNENILMIILLSLFLTIVSELGDLVFSNIKRYFKKKDFSNLIRGHGGILDRFDSIIFVTLVYYLIILLF